MSTDKPKSVANKHASVEAGVEKLDPKKVLEAIREATPVSEFEKAMDKARGFHSYYEGTLDNAALTRLSD